MKRTNLRGRRWPVWTLIALTSALTLVAGIQVNVAESGVDPVTTTLSLGGQQCQVQFGVNPGGDTVPPGGSTDFTVLVDWMQGECVWNFQIQAAPSPSSNITVAPGEWQGTVGPELTHWEEDGTITVGERVSPGEYLIPFRGQFFVGEQGQERQLTYTLTVQQPPTATSTSTATAIPTETPVPTSTPPRPRDQSITVLKLDATGFQPLSGWPMTLYGSEDCSGRALAEGTTDENGLVDFIGLNPGTYSVLEGQKAGHEPVSPQCQTVHLPDGANPDAEPAGVRGFPPAGEDRFDSGAHIVLQLRGNELGLTQQQLHVTVNGPTVIRRDDPGDRDQDGRADIETEIVSMNLRGTTSLGELRVRESAIRPSWGLIEQQEQGKDFPADSFFDVFVEIDTPLGTLHNRDPIRLETQINEIPPVLDFYRPPEVGRLPLYDEAGQLVGYILHAMHLPLPPREKLVVFVNRRPPRHSVTVLKLNADDFRPLPRWPMTLYGTPDCSGPVLAEGVTDGQGLVDFTGLLRGVYSVREGQKAGYASISPVCQRVEVGGNTSADAAPMGARGYPPAGEDRFDSGAHIVLQLPGNRAGMTEQQIPVTLNGPTVIQRRDPGDRDQDGRADIQTEIVEMNLVGMSPLGEVRVRESARRRSPGLIEQQKRGEDFPADSFFDVFVDIETPLGTLHNEDPIRMETVISEIPPVLDLYRPPEVGRLPLYDENGRLVGYILHAMHLPLPPREKLIVFVNRPPRRLDFVAQVLEVTQAVQYVNLNNAGDPLNNSVVLVEDKRTYVRFHVRADRPNTQAVTARLRGFRNGAPLGTLVPLNAPLVIRPDPDRGQINHSFLFELPAAWRRGRVRLEARVNQPWLAFETNYGNNTASDTVTFRDTPPLRINLVRVHYRTTAGGALISPRAVDLTLLRSWLRRAYPVSQINVGVRDLVLPWVGSPDQANAPDANPNDGDWSAAHVNSLLSITRLLDLLFGGGDARTRYYGLVSDQGAFMRGLAANIPGRVASGPAGVPAGGFAWDTDTSYADWYGGHETGHLFGRRHANFCGAAAGAPYPYPSGRISWARESRSHYGFDIELRRVYPPMAPPNPRGWTDVMTYCANEWISDFTYTGIRNRIVADGLAAQGLHEKDSLGVSERLLVTGIANLTDGSAALSALYRLPEPVSFPTRVPGDWSIRLLAADDSILAEYPFTPQPDPEIEPGGDQTATISELVPFVPSTARVVIWHGGGERASRVVSANPPTVEVTSPQGGENLTGPTITVSWTANDPDGDPLTYNLLYSDDGGAKWQTLRAGLTSTSEVLDASQIPGTNEGLFRVVANDGVNIGQDDTDGTFSVPDKPPQVEIIAPLSGDAYVFGQLVNLIGEGTDLEDGLLSDSALSWRSDRDGFLGTGHELAAALSQGAHVLTFTATDSQGHQTSATVSVTVGPSDIPNLYLPLAVRNR